LEVVDFKHLAVAMCEGVSVVIPAYNYGKFLAESIESVLSQTHQDLEIIVVDDGSTDQTRSIVGKISDSRLRYLYQTNQGLSAARNTGIRNSRHPFVAFLDADDLWLPGMLQAALEQFSRLSSDYAMVACFSLRMTESGVPIDRVEVRAGEELQTRQIQAKHIVLKSRFMPSSVVVKRHVFTELGSFDTALRSSEDRDMWIRIAQKYRVLLFSQPLVRIRKHGNNMSKNADRMRVNMRKVLRKYFASRKQQSPLDWIVMLKAFSFYHFELAWMYFDEHRVPEAIRSLIASLALWPCFLGPRKKLDQPIFFRARALARFLLNPAAQ
jgi:glycosyltransferase involved in cell wall biosynthesis